MRSLKYEERVEKEKSNRMCLLIELPVEERQKLKAPGIAGNIIQQAYLKAVDTVGIIEYPEGEAVQKPLNIVDRTN